MSREDNIQDAAGEDGLPRGQAEEYVCDFARGQRDHAHDEAVKEQAEIECAKAAHK